MKIITKAVLDMNTMQRISVEAYDYEGPLELCDRSAVQAQKGLRDVNATNAAAAGGQADTEHSALTPFYSNEMKAEHLFDPNQQAELLTSAEAPLGSSLGDTQHAAELQAARTRNASGFTKTLQQAQRDRDKAMAGASEGVASQDILGAKQLQQEGAKGMSDLFKTDTQKQLESLGLEENAIKGQAEAGTTGWLQNLNKTVEAAGSLIG